MPDPEGNPTEVETIQALGWDPTPDVPEPTAAAPSPEPAPTAAAPVGTPPALTAAAPAPEPVATAAAPVYTPPALTVDPMAVQREAEIAQYRQREIIAQINQRAQTYMNGKLAQGWDQDHAKEAAEQYAQNLYSNHQTQETRRVANEQAKTALAYQKSQQYGAPFDMLMNYDSPTAMEQAAKFYQETTGRIRSLEAENRNANKAPVQDFDSNTHTASNSVRAMKLRYATDPNFSPSEEQLARIMGS